MVKRELTFSLLQITALLLSYFILAFVFAGSHGKIYFFPGGWKFVLILTLILSSPLVYLFMQRDQFKYRKTIFFVAILLLSLSITPIYFGFPTFTSQFTIDKNEINNTIIYADNDLTINLKFRPEMFNRVGIEASIIKSQNVELKKLDLTILSNGKEIIKPVFQPLAWDSLHNQHIQIDSYFEVNNYTKMNKFFLSAQYPIEHFKSLEIHVNNSFTKNGQNYTSNKQLEVKITDRLTFEKLIQY